MGDKEETHMPRRRKAINSDAVDFAAAEGLPRKMAYTVAETARFTGVSKYALYREIEAGRLHPILRRGQKRGWMVRAEEVDRWMAESQEGAA